MSTTKRAGRRVERGCEPVQEVGKSDQDRHEHADDELPPQLVPDGIVGQSLRQKAESGDEAKGYECRCGPAGGRSVTAPVLPHAGDGEQHVKDGRRIAIFENLGSVKNGALTVV